MIRSLIHFASFLTEKELQNIDYKLKRWRCPRNKKIQNLKTKIIFLAHFTRKEPMELLKNSKTRLFKIKFCWRQIFKHSSSRKLSWGLVRSHTNLGPIGSAVLAFIGYRKIDRHKQSIYMNIFIYI